MFHDLFNGQANQLARETGLVQREREIRGADFVQGLVFGWLHPPAARLGQVVQAISLRQVSLSASALSQRCTEKAATCLQRMLTAVVEQVVASEHVGVALLQRFEAVIVQESSLISVPDEVQEPWGGCRGNQAHTEAAIKLHVRWDLLDGRREGLVLTDGRVADQRSPLRTAGIPKGVLSITDEGYFGLTWLKEQAQAAGLFFTRPRHTTVFFDEPGRRLDLDHLGPQVVHQRRCLWALAGAQVRVRVRLLMGRVPEEVIEQRPRRIRETACKHRHEPNAQQLALAAWTILITKVPAEQLTPREALVLSPARWQIERLFPLWKEKGLIDEWRSKNRWRLLGEMSGKLIAQVVQHWCLLERWPQPDRSLVKAAQVVRSHALQFIELLMGQYRLRALLHKLSLGMASGRLERRSKHPNLSQLLIAGLDWP